MQLLSIYQGKFALNDVNYKKSVYNRFIMKGASKLKHYEVVAAIIEHEGRILCMQRNKGKFDYVSYKYEFPGGKVEAGEDNHTALERELREEMDMHINISEQDYFMTINHTYPDFAITMHCYLCKLAHPKFVMKEHVDAKWMLPEEMHTLDWAPADWPIVKKLEEHFCK